MAAPNIPAAKRAGLPVDVQRLALEGDGFLTAEERYALKTYGVCTQEQDHVFMVRIRIPGGALPTRQARGLARLARRFGEDWVHLTTRQNVELHWVADRDVPDLLHGIEEFGMSTRSACGHTLRNVMASEEAGVSLDEPFDCFPDARATSDAIVARSARLNCELPSRINIAFGGSPRCREDALLNDAGFVSVVRDGEAGYEVWAGGSLGKAPALAIKLADFVPRRDVLAASDALIEVFIAHGDFDKPAKARMKYVVSQLGEDGFRAAWEQAFEEARRRTYPPLPAVEVLEEADIASILRVVPQGGWTTGVRPQRQVGLAYLTVDVPMGDLHGADIELLADLADQYCDGALNLSRDQDVVLRGVPVGAVSHVRQVLASRGLFLAGEAQNATLRACTGSAVCALGIVAAPTAGAALRSNASLGRNSSLRVHISGCPNSCAQHQAGDIGLSGTKVRLGGGTRDGYHVYLGADLEHHQLGEVMGRIAAEDVPSAVDAIVGTWEAMRHGAESLGRTVRRIGMDGFASHIEALMAERWATGPEPDDVAAAGGAPVSVRPTNPAPPNPVPADAPRVAVARVDDLVPGTATTIRIADRTLALVNAGGTFHAVEGECPHAGAMLGEGEVDGCVLSCPLHAATFDVRTGEALSGPAPRGVRTYPVHVVDGVVEVQVGHGITEGVILAGADG